MKKLIYVLVSVCTFTIAKASADDIDIYLGGASNSGAPYVHLMLDYRPSVFSSLCTFGSSCNVVSDDGTCPTGICFTQNAMDLLGADSGDTVTRFDAFVAVMGSIFSNELFESIYMALLIPNFENGGTLLEGYKQLGAYYDPNDPDVPEVPSGTTGAVTGAEKLIATMQDIPIPSSRNSVHKLQPKEAYFEWYRYLNGGAIIHGDQTDGNFDAASNEEPVPNYDSSTMDSHTDPQNYVSPFTDASECSKLFSIAVAMNTANQDDDLDDEIGDDQYDGLGISTRGSFKFEDFLEEVHNPAMDLVDDRYLAGINPLEKTWVISDDTGVGQTDDWAAAGGSGSHLSLDDPAKLEEDLTNAFKEVISVSSTFVAASVPVNVFNRAESLDNLFIALFEAQETQNWPGNIKKLKLRDLDSDGAYDDIVDASATPKPGFASTGADRGRITFDALTYWTIAATLPSIATTLAPSGADGREVARGGAGQKITGFVDTATEIIGDTNAGVTGVSTRQIYVEPASFTNGTATAFDDFDVDSGTLALTGIKAALGNSAMTDADALDLIRWGRGQDVNNGSTNARSWIMADAIHSRPVAINYGAVDGYSMTNPNIRLFFGTGDGLFHILENTTASAVESGAEVFAFYPRELLGNINVRKTDTASSLKMRYGVDGPPTAFTVDNNSDGNLVGTGSAPMGGDEVYIYFGLRRGGISYYALDVSDVTTAPKIKWKITRTSGGDFDELGLTFSKPLVGKVKYGSSEVDVVIFAGGYNGGWDEAYANRVGKDLNSDPDNVGNAIYIVNARTGALIWKAVNGTGNATSTVYEHSDLVDSIPSDITPVTNANGVIHRLYVGDTGGAVWRVDLPELSSDDRASAWFISKLAELGNDGTNASSDRRFFHSPDVVETFDSAGDFDGLIISSGDRAHPNETEVNNYHFYIKDRLIRSGDPSVLSRVPLTIADTAPADLPDQTLCVLGTEESCAASLPNGWKIKLNGSGEKGLSTALVDGGRVFMSTFVPASGVASCAPTEGEGFVYVVNLEDGTAVYDSRSYNVGYGIPSGAITMGNMIITPGAGIDPYDPDDQDDPDHPDYTPDPDNEDDYDEPCTGKLCKSLTERLYRIYWREPGIDAL